MIKEPALWDKDKAKAQTWYRKPICGCVCSDGDPYSITLKKGTANKLLVHFVGGGISWNEHTAAMPYSFWAMMNKKEAFYVSGIPRIMMDFMHVGILKADDLRNPFHDWHVVNIPYVTADFHIGSNDFHYKDAKGRSKELYHHGQKNTEAILPTISELVGQTPDALAIAGESAGGFGCVANCPKVASLYPDCDNIVVYSEASHFHSPLWQNITRDVWKISSDLAAYIKCDDLIVDLFRYAQDHMPSHTMFLHSNSLYDRTLAQYMHKMNHGKMAINPQALNEFYETLISAVRLLKSEISNYSFYLTDYGKSQSDGATPHTFAGTPKLLYGDMQDGTSVAAWIRQALEGKRADVGAKFVQ